MAAQPPDVLALNSWEDAFQNPLPVVRKLELQLRKNIDDNRQKLRSLVGASYRDLLGTAERIIEMDEQVQTVETYLGDIGKKCNARMVERITENHTRMSRAKDARIGERYGTVAQTKVLRSTLTATARVVRGVGDALQAAKLLVLSRLLLKSVSEGPQPPAVLAELRQKLHALRAKLLSYIERSMVLRIVEEKALGNILCAYALVTSSSPKEVLRHFLQVRYDQLDNDTDSPVEVDIVSTLDLYSQTLFDTREIFPRRFTDALSQLSKVPLLKDPQIQSMPELNIDIYRHQIAEDIRTFTPWVRHDQLSSNEVTEALASWTKQAQTCLITGLHHSLSKQTDAREILISRHTFLSKFIGLSSRLKNATSTRAIQDLRVVFSTRLEELAVQAAQITNLTLEESEISALLESDTQDGGSTIWDLAPLSSTNNNISQGAFALRESIISHRHGRTPALKSQIIHLDIWLQSILIFLDIAEEMRGSKWDDDLDFDLDDGLGDSLHQNLSKDDPDHLREVLRDAVAVAVNEVVGRVEAAVGETRWPAFWLRVWREIDLRRRALDQRLNVPIQPISLVDLHKSIARGVSGGCIRDYISAAREMANTNLTLWDGSPPLPVQPSPGTFRFLTTLHKAMSAAGNDLWTPHCVGELKGVVVEGLAQGFADEENEKGLTNGHVEESGAAENEEEEGDEVVRDPEHIANEEERNEAAQISEPIDNNEERNDELAQTPNPEPNSATRARGIQHLFDLQYLRHVLHHSGQEEGSGLNKVVETLKTKADLDEMEMERLGRSAREYWKRTFLLFGLFAEGGGGGG